MARWTICWLLLISTATAGAYWGTNAFLPARSVELQGPQADETYGMHVLGGLGSPECAEAARLLVAAGDGAQSTALPDERRDWDRAARTVLEVCADN